MPQKSILVIQKSGKQSSSAVWRWIIPGVLLQVNMPRSMKDFIDGVKKTVGVITNGSRSMKNASRNVWRQNFV